MIERSESGGSKQIAGDKNREQAISEGDRRRFLELCSKFAVGMPPAIALLVSSPNVRAFDCDDDDDDDDGDCPPHS